MNINIGRSVTGSIVVNGKVVSVPPGASVSIIDGIVFVNGKPWNETEKLSGIVKVEVVGSLINLSVHNAPVSVGGNVEGNIECGGSATIGGSVSGDVNSGGSL